MDAEDWSAGWYPASPGTLRYYDGEKWTDSYAPSPEPFVPELPERVPAGVLVVGVIFGLLVPLVGAIIAISQWNKVGSMSIRVATVVGFVLWWIALTQG